MLDANTERLVQLTIRQLRSNVRSWLLLGIIISAVAIFVGMNLPKQYSAYASIRVEQQKVVGSLMEDLAEQTDVRDQVAIVRELASSRRLLESMLERGEFVEPDANLVEKERAMDGIKGRTQINNRGGNLIGISYSDSDPDRAFLITETYIDWVLSESRSSKKRESMEAYNFIDQQVKAYESKLRTAEEGLKTYRTDNMDALPESAADVRSRATALRREMEGLQLETSELRVREHALADQLSGEAEITDARAEENEFRTRLMALQQQLDTLRLSYHDTYPDIVRVKSQLVELRSQMRSTMAQNDSGKDETGLGQTNIEGQRSDRSLNPLYESLRAEAASVRTQIRTNEARYTAMEKVLDKEISRSRRIADSEATLAELTRDYDVNRDLYQDLLRRRENARLSMNLDNEQQGVRMKIQEPPAVPGTPSGIRFLHVIAAAAMAVVAMPIALSAMLVQFDPRIRMKYRIEALNLPVLAVVPKMDTAPPWRRGLRMASLAFFGLVLVSLYAGAAWIKLQGQV